LNLRGLFDEFGVVRVFLEVGGELRDGLEANEERYVEVLEAIRKVTDRFHEELNIATLGRPK
jgi:hypothetical protein